MCVKRASVRILQIVLSVSMLLVGVASGGTLDEAAPALVKTLAKQLVARQRPKVATVDFTDIQGRPNELGRFLAEQLSVDMVAADGITVIDRANLSAVMAEHKLTAEGLVNPDNARKLGQFAGVDALLIGNLAAMDNTFTLTVKAISTETSEIVAAGRMRFDVTQDMMRQFTTAISVDAVIAPEGGGAAGSAQSSEGIASKRFGNLEIVLKSVAPSSAQDGRGNNVPAIRCSFELYNRDLRSSVVIAANGAMNDHNFRSEVALDYYRGELLDSNGVKWWIAPALLKGVSSVICFECQNAGGAFAHVKQNNPTAIASYIQHGQYGDFGRAQQERLISDGKAWAGSFSTIPPGQSIRMTVQFIPATPQNQQRTLPKPSQSFHFDMELVIGTVTSSVVPEKAKDLRLENLVFDKIVLPTVAP